MNQIQQGLVPDIRDANKSPIQVIGVLTLCVQLRTQVVSDGFFVCIRLAAPVIIGCTYLQGVQKQPGTFHTACHSYGSQSHIPKIDILAFSASQKAKCVPWYSQTASVTQTKRNFRREYGVRAPLTQRDTQMGRKLQHSRKC
eukprot:IDg15717t1